MNISKEICPNCEAGNLSTFYRVDNVPVHSCLLVSTYEEAVNFPRKDIELGFCENCGFISNMIFDPTVHDYSPGYEDQQSFSGTFNKFAHDLADRLISQYGLRGKRVLEIGCGKGDFLILLCELGGNKGIGIDPSCVPGRVETESADDVVFVQDFYSEQHSEYEADFICCRHTLEHIHKTAAFVQIIRKSIRADQDPVVFFELPDITRVLKEIAFWDIYYEHCSYFSIGSLARLFRYCDFEIVDLRTEYGGQYLTIDAQRANCKPAAGKPADGEPADGEPADGEPAEGKPADGEPADGERTEGKPADGKRAGGEIRNHPLENDMVELKRSVDYFAANYEKKFRLWRDFIDQHKAHGNRVAIWGSGSKCVAFLTTLRMEDEVDMIVDVNPYRHGKFIPGVAKQIMSPEKLQEMAPDVVLIMNPIYQPEIEAMLADMNVHAEVAAV